MRCQQDDENEWFFHRAPAPVQVFNEHEARWPRRLKPRWVCGVECCGVTWAVRLGSLSNFLLRLGSLSNFLVLVVSLGFDGAFSEHARQSRCFALGRHLRSWHPGSAQRSAATRVTLCPGPGVYQGYPDPGYTLMASVAFKTYVAVNSRKQSRAALGAGVSSVLERGFNDPGSG